MFEHLRELSLAVAPELGDQPLYLIRSPKGLPTRPNTGAYAVTADSYAHRQHLIDLGLWQGPGNIVCYVMARIADLPGITLHEIAHLLPTRPPRQDRDPDQEVLAFEKELISEYAADPNFEDNSPPWEFHEGGFIRRTLHLQYRATKLGHDIDARSLSIAGSRYGLSYAGRYEAALGDEPARMIDATFSEIADTPPPTAFTQLFEDDCRRYHEMKEQIKCN